MPASTRSRTRWGLAYLLYCITRASVHKGLRYRGATFSHLVVHSLFGLVRASLLVAAIDAARDPISNAPIDSLHGYTVAQAITYAWLTQAMIGPLHAFAWATLSTRIYDGSIATDMARPLNPLAWYWCEFFGESIVGFLTRSVPLLLVGAISTQFMLGTNLEMASDPGIVALGFVVLTLAAALTYLLFFMVNCLAFYVTQIRGLMTTYMLLAQVLSGFMVPLTWFPQWYQSAIAYLPHPYIFQFSVDTFAGRLDYSEIASGLLRQVLWLVICLLAAWRCVEVARRRVEVQGG